MRAQSIVLGLTTCRSQVRILGRSWAYGGLMLFAMTILNQSVLISGREKSRLAGC